MTRDETRNQEALITCRRGEIARADAKCPMSALCANQSEDSSWQVLPVAPRNAIAASSRAEKVILPFSDCVLLIALSRHGSVPTS